MARKTSLRRWYLSTNLMNSTLKENPNRPTAAKRCVCVCVSVGGYVWMCVCLCARVGGLQMTKSSRLQYRQWNYTVWSFRIRVFTLDYILHKDRSLWRALT